MRGVHTVHTEQHDGYNIDIETEEPRSKKYKNIEGAWNVSIQKKQQQKTRNLLSDISIITIPFPSNLERSS